MVVGVGGAIGIMGALEGRWIKKGEERVAENFLIGTVDRPLLNYITTF